MLRRILEAMRCDAMRCEESKRSVSEKMVNEHARRSRRGVGVEEERSRAVLLEVQPHAYYGRLA